MIGAIILNYTTINHAILIIGVFAIITISILSLYLRSKVGLNPEEYRQEDIDYDYYIKRKGCV